MGRLDDVDLSQSLSKKEEAKELERAQTRLAQLRLTLGGQLAVDGELDRKSTRLNSSH